MASDGLHTIIGALGREPELRFTQSGKAVASFSVAVSRRWKQGDDWKEVTTWYNCTAWDAMAENVAASCHKGTRVVITGSPELRKYESNGEEKVSLDFRVDEIAVSLKWARCEIERVEREKDNQVRDTRPRGQRKAPDEPSYSDDEVF